MKRRVNPGWGVGALATAQRTLQGYEALYLLRKGQIEGLAKGEGLAQNRIINQLFGLAASRELTTEISPENRGYQNFRK